MADFRTSLAQQAARNSAQAPSTRSTLPDLKQVPSDAIPTDESDNELLAQELAAAQREGYGGNIVAAEITEEEQQLGGPPPPAAPPRTKGNFMKTRNQTPAPAAHPAPEQEPEETDEEDVAAEAPPLTPMDFLNTLDGAPDAKQIEMWKRQYRDIYMMPLEGSGVFIFRYLTNFEWKMQLQPQEKLMSDENALQEAILARCVLHPKYTPETMNTTQAGLPALMFEIIMKASYFIDASDAMMQVMRL